MPRSNRDLSRIKPGVTAGEATGATDQPEVECCIDNVEVDELQEIKASSKSVDMNVLFISIDSLRKDMLGAYDSPFDWVEDLSVETPNLDQFAEKSITFDSHYAGSLPCMPARREWDTGIQEFLWRGWGPTEAYDTTLPEKARNAGVLTKLITDHFHLFQHGSSGYYEDYHGFEFIRGHEDDLWKTQPYGPDQILLQQVGYDLEDAQEEITAEVSDAAANPNHVLDPYDLEHYRPHWKYVRNVAEFDDNEEDFFAAKVFSSAADWIENNVIFTTKG